MFFRKKSAISPDVLAEEFYSWVNGTHELSEIEKTLIENGEVDEAGVGLEERIRNRKRPEDPTGTSLPDGFALNSANEVPTPKATLATGTADVVVYPDRIDWQLAGANINAITPAKLTRT